MARTSSYAEKPYCPSSTHLLPAKSNSGPAYVIETWISIILVADDNDTLQQKERRKKEGKESRRPLVLLIHLSHLE